MTRARLAVLISGSGTLMAALAEAAEQSSYPAEIVCVIADRPDATGLEKAAARGIPTRVVAPGDFEDRAAWNTGLALAVAQAEPDWVISAGFMRILGEGFLSCFPGSVINTHPALLPSFPGAHGVRDALAYGVRVTGSTIHLVDAGVDTGPIIDQRPVTIEDHDDEASLHERIKIVERELLVETVARIARSGLTVTGRKVTIP